ncbi:hypothetical protein [Flavobacterium tegetincola]|uniref:hypothetical protein n=1 Tax=Flavobacterium tegetincola TaxID=150172 RepID=UPI00047A363E|nr:hypothetical protein [Flavobacterium tegetincola]
MKIVTTIMLSLISVLVYAQKDEVLTLTLTKENVVASAIDGHWKPKSEESKFTLEFTNDVGVLKIISKKYYKDFTSYQIYHAGYMKINEKGKITTHPYIVTNINGNPHLVFFRERDGNPIGDAESFILFIARTKDGDRLFTGGDFNNESFVEYERMEVK